jgi:hypothetical protein
VHVLYVPIDDLEGKVLLVREVVVERTPGGRGGGQQRLDAEIVVPMFQEHGQPGIEQALFRRMHGSFRGR